APLGHDRDALAQALLGPHRGGFEPRALEHPPDHDLHLERREACTEAAPGPASERDPRVRVGHVLADEPLGPEGVWLRIAVGPPVDRRDRRVDLDPRRNQIVAELERLAANDAPDTRNDGPQAERLLHDGLEILAVPPREA